MWLRFGVGLLLAGAVAAQQSNNYTLPVVPAPGPVVIDGRLDEWDRSGELWCYADEGLRDRLGVKAMGMWTAEALYLAAEWRDPTPLHNLIDPDFEPTRGWAADCWQIRVKTDTFAHLTCWHHTPKQEPVIHIDYADYGPKKQLKEPVLLRRTAGWELTGGAAMAFGLTADGRGYVQEIRLPWALLFDAPPTVGPGFSWRMGWEFLWGDESGKQWPSHRYADLVNAAQPSREFFWSASNSWGEATCLPGSYTKPAPPAGEAPLVDPIPIRMAVPAEARRFTLAVDDTGGRRIRNLIADVDPAELRQPDGTVEVRWDGLDDQGQAVAAGDYRVRGLWHTGLRATYSMSYYNPGRPPWNTADGTGNWGADHTEPRAAAAAGGRVFLGWPLAEGGWAIIAVDERSGRKLWGFKRGWDGAHCLAANDRYVWVGTAEGTIYRLHADRGTFAPFIRDGQELVDLKLGEDVALAALAVNGADLWAAVTNREQLVRLDAGSGEVRATLPTPGLRSVAIADGAVHLLRDDRLVALDGGTGITLPGWDPVTLAGDDAGRRYVWDAAARQVRVIEPNGQLRRTIGVPGGRPAVGAFEPRGLRAVTALAVDGLGQVWSVENDDRPRRISVWGTDGRLVRDYVGNTNYSATGSFLDPSDPTRAFYNALEFRLDYDRQTYQLVRTLWRREVDRAWFDAAGWGGQLLRSAASGRDREYLVYSASDRSLLYNSAQVVFVPEGDRWRPCAAVGSINERNQYISGARAVGTILEQHLKSNFAWNDLNGDGLCQDVEFAFRTDLGTPECGWSTQVGSDLALYLSGQKGVFRYRPTGFGPAGEPRYDVGQAEPVVADDSGNVAPLADGGLLLLSSRNYPAQTRGVVRYDDRGQALWTYPNRYPGVHGSHRATMPQPGLVIGPLRISGVADIADVGPVAALHGNLGQEFLLTVDDGLFVGALFQDYRMAPEPLPVEARQGVDVSRTTLGSEPFGGWFGRSPDGRVRLLGGGQDARIYEIHGLETVRRLPTASVSVTDEQVREAARLLAERQRRASGPATGTIARAERAPTIDGNLADWPKTAPLEIKAGPQRVATVRLAYDTERLYLGYDVTDSTPLRNAGQDWQILFKGGDAIDLMLAADPAADPRRSEPVAGDLRLLLTLHEGQPVAVLYRPVAPGTPADQRVRFTSPVRSVVMDRVERVEAVAAFRPRADGYTAEVAVPWTLLGVVPRAGLTLQGDVGVIFSDDTGTTNLRRSYWANPSTVIVSDIPSEAELTPRYWGRLTLD